MNNKKSPDLKKSILIGVVFGTLVFVASFIGGYAITAIAGSGTSGVVTATITSALVVIAGLLCKRFPTLITVNVVFSILAVPTTIFGAPFGITKILYGFGTGLIYELIVGINREKTINYILAAGAAAFCSVYMIYYGTTVLIGESLPTLEKYLHYFAIVYSILGAFGGWLGSHLFNKLRNNESINELMQ